MKTVSSDTTNPPTPERAEAASQLERRRTGWRVRVRFNGTALIPWTFKFKKTKFLRIKCLLPRPNLYPKHFQFRPDEWHMLTHHLLLFLVSHSREESLADQVSIWILMGVTALGINSE